MVPDSTALGYLGLILGGVTAAVTVVAFFVVQQYVDGRLVLDPVPAVVAMVR